MSSLKICVWDERSSRVFSRHAGHQFWIVAICINQNDMDERNRQDHILANVYCLATTAVNWLGERYAGFKEASTAEPQGPLLLVYETQPEDKDGWGPAGFGF
ncbi:ankyrin and het domain-containing protein [Ophiostoma piceae UAMH 11346]|uniref:Ankyrin and het domain-containing protein n=1 Tax=Ophiostoma piceae (strain UAMH 11346) TaxID=1262450 RepID=S3BY09_OPHP1|nr:ankyrin and het domain-containing protein [Ophiostoma piceae UAMH 11346]